MAAADPARRPLWPGTSGPARGTPPRPAGSVRRTSAVDISFTDDLSILQLRGSGRDLRTAVDGRTEVVAEAATSVSVDLATRTVVAVDAQPASPSGDLHTLVGVPAGSRFRAALGLAAPELVASGSLLGLLLDEVPVATLISGSSLSRRGLIPATAQRNRMPLVGVCAGWMPDGAMVRVIERGDQPMLGEGPLVPDLDEPDDPLAWHSLADLPPGSMRRRRRLDLFPGRPLAVDVLFRDSYVESDGRESGIHEYGITADFDLAGTILTITAEPHVLPGPDCPLAAASAQRLVGMRLDEVRRHVREEFKGTSTCTHLNDALRSLGDLAALLPHVTTSAP